MTNEHDTAAEIAARARQLLEDEMNARVESVHALAVAGRAAADAEERARETAANHQTAYRAALDSGWTETALRKSGIRAPEVALKPKRRNARNSVTTATEVTSG